jgi:hypothetical protein
MLQILIRRLAGRCGKGEKVVSAREMTFAAGGERTPEVAATVSMLV